VSDIPTPTPADAPVALADSPAPSRDPLTAEPPAAPGASDGRLRLPVALAVAATSGVLLWTAFPGLDWWPLAPVAVAGLALACRGQRPRRALLLGLVTGLAFFVPHLHWSGIYVGVLPWAALAGIESCYVAVMAASLPLAWRAPGGRAGTAVAVSGLWVAQEALRGRAPFGGFPWARLAFSQADGPLLSVASLGGAPLVTGAVAAVGACLALAVAALLDAAAEGDRRPSGGDRRRLLAAAGLPVAVGLALVAAATAVPRPTGASRTVAVAAVQGNVPTAGLDFNAQRRAVLDNHAAATERLAAAVRAGRAPQPDVVLWPENSSDIDPLRNPDAAAVISAATDSVGVPVVVGAILLEPADHISNASIVWGPDGGPAPGPGARYTKRHPAPFAEYIPLRAVARVFSDKVDLVAKDMAPGRTVGVLNAGGARLGDIICFEVAYDDLVRDTVNAGADLLLVQTNNATFGYSDESVQQLAMSRLRAVETGRAVVHVSTVGVSGLIAPDGHVLERSGHFTTDVLQARLPLRTDRTVATRVGVAPEAALAALGLLLPFLAARPRRPRRRAGTATPTTRTKTGPGDSAGTAGQESRQ